MRDSEIELRPAQLPRPPVLGSEEQCKHGDSIAGMGDRGLSSGVQTRAANDPSEEVESNLDILLECCTKTILSALTDNCKTQI